MDTFHHQDVVLLQVHLLPLEDRLSLLEVITGQFNLLPCQQRIEVLSQKLQVHSLQGLEVVIAKLVLRRSLP